MSRYDRYDRYSRFPKYVSVAERKQKAYKTAAKMDKGDLSPVVLSGHKISNTFWGKAWCDNVESYQDYSNRLPRGRSYVRSGAVIDLKIAKGSITALVCGSGRTPYKIDITIEPLKKPRWEALKKQCLGRIDSLVSLVQGKLSHDTISLFCDRNTGIFPAPSEIKMKCSCPDSAGLCKHLAAVLYGIGARLDTDPKLFFVLRGIDETELINADVVDALTEGVTSEIDEASISAVFGVDFDTLDPKPPVDAPSPPPSKTKKTTTKPASTTKPTTKPSKAASSTKPTTKPAPPSKRATKSAPPKRTTKRATKPAPASKRATTSKRTGVLQSTISNLQSTIPAASSPRPKRATRPAPSTRPAPATKRATKRVT